jgi:hypothetical protein
MHPWLDDLRMVERADEADATHHRLGDAAPPEIAPNVKRQGIFGCQVDKG